MLLLLAAGLARPTVTTLRRASGATPRPPRSLCWTIRRAWARSTAIACGFETAAAAAAQILDQLGRRRPGGGAADLRPAVRRRRPARTARRTPSARSLAPMPRQLRARRPDGPKLQQARELLAKSDAPNKQIYVLTDMQRGSWEGRGQAVREKAEGGRRRAGHSPSPRPHGLGQPVGSAPRIIDAAPTFRLPPSPFVPDYPHRLQPLRRNPTSPSKRWTSKRRSPCRACR